MQFNDRQNYLMGTEVRIVVRGGLLSERGTGSLLAGGNVLS